jgi:hypothetical protein
MWIDDLDPCTLYCLEVRPVITGNTFTENKNDFTTTNGTPEAPLGFKAQMQGEDAAMSWDPVQCATGYLVYHKIGHDANEVATKTDRLEEVQQGPIPCENYYYSVATLVGEQESARTEWQSLVVPPREKVAPNLKIVSNENDNITLSLEPEGANAKCTPVKYALNYSASGYEPYETKVMYPEDVKEGYLELKFYGASGPNTIVTAKIKYADSDVWSGEARSREAGDLSKMQQVAGGGASSIPIIPIVIGLVVAVIIVIVIVVVLMRKNRRGAGYDAEKANGENGRAVTNDETQKLNENMPDA